MAKRAKIGISIYNANGDRRFFIPKDYVVAIEKAGGIAYLLPPSTLSADEVMDGLDGLILSGGGDIHPAIYGGRNHETIYNTDSARDTFELELADYAIRQEIPLLGICRGAQIINVAQGGTLYEDISTYFGSSVLHRTHQEDPISHTVHLTKNSILERIFDKETIKTTSWHHQAVRNLGSDLMATAHAPDNVIEAIEMPSHPWLVGVQWHPEYEIHQDPVQMKLFLAFLEFASARKIDQ